MSLFQAAPHRSISDAVADLWQSPPDALSSFTAAGALMRIPDDLAVVSSANLADMDLVAHPGGCGCFGCGVRDDDEGAGTGPVLVSSSLQAASLQDLADYLREGYWSDSNWYSFNWNMTGSGSNSNSGELLYNLSGYDFSDEIYDREDTNGISNARKELVRDSFDLFEEVLGINFTETTSQDPSDVDFFFSDNDGGAYASTWINTSSGTSSISFVNVAADWSGSTSTFDDYTLQTILHEIGHALGLGHQGNYNGSAGYPGNAKFANDSWQASMMSYFSQSENSTIPADREFLQTPMSVDWLALEEMYGDQSFGGTTFGLQNAFEGDTVYGFNTNISASVSEIWALFADYADRTASTIVDGGGRDTLDFSGYSENQRIDLRPSSTNSTTPVSSDVGGRVGNLTIAVGTVIENAVTGSGDDTITGNDADNLIVANGGDDTIAGGLGDDTIEGGGGTDTLVLGADLESTSISQQSADRWIFSLEGGTRYDASSVEFVQFTDTTVAVDDLEETGDVEEPEPVLPGDALTDFTDDGTSDVLWRDGASGRTGYWEMDGGARTWNEVGTVTTAWDIVGSGNFSGSSADDVLWRNTETGRTGYWEMDDGDFTFVQLSTVGLNWDVFGVGDFDGNEQDDILWRDTDSGRVGYYRMENGNFTWTPLSTVSETWQIVGTGDFDGNGQDDILWRDTATGRTGYYEMDGSEFSWNELATVDLDWKVVGTGDFNGDGEADILWRNTESGRNGYWEMTDGDFAWREISGASGNWEVAATGDYSADGSDDILWRDTNSGRTGYWDVDGSSTSWTELGVVGLNWDVEGTAPDPWWV